MINFIRINSKNGRQYCIVRRKRERKLDQPKTTGFREPNKAKFTIFITVGMEQRNLKSQKMKRKKTGPRREIIPPASHGRSFFAPFCTTVYVYFDALPFVLGLTLLQRCCKHGNRDKTVKCQFCQYGVFILLIFS